MKFNCGPTRITKKHTRDVYLRNWHRHYAILPRRVDVNDCRWFEWIERRGCRQVTRFLGRNRWIWEYCAND